MVHAIGSSHLSQQPKSTEFATHSAVQHGISSASTLRSAAQGADKSAEPAASGGMCGCISKVATSIKNFFSGILNWFLNLCGKGSGSNSSAAPAKGSLEAFLAILDDKDAKSSAQKQAFKKLHKKDLIAVAKEMRAHAKEKNQERKKANRKVIGDVSEFRAAALADPLVAKVRDAVEAVVKARAEAAKKAA